MKELLRLTRVVDRLKDMIIRSGMNIYPAEVEAVLHEHPKVLEALVIGIPDATRGELVKAFVVPRDGVTLAEEEILAFCRQNLAKYKVPSAVEIRDGHVYVDGQLLVEEYLKQLTLRGMGPKTISEGHIFVLGDNRGASNDSRIFGEVAISSIIGRAWVRYWPLGEVALFH